MPDNEMDDIIRKAAGEYHPPYNDKAWEKMEQLLDKHLPVQKDRNYRALYLLLLLLLIGDGIYFGISHFSANSPSTIAHNTTNNDNSENKNTTSNSSIDKTNTTQSGKENTVTNDKSENENSTKTGAVSNSLVSVATTTYTNNKTTNNKTNNLSRAKFSIRNKTKVSVNNADANTDVVTNNDNIITSNAKTGVKSDNKQQKADVAVNSNGKKDDAEKQESVKKDSPDKKDTSSKKATTSTVKKKEKNNFANNFGISFSIGPDVSYVRAKDMGTVAANYGVGLSYKLSKRFTIQTGFYTSNKIYTADSMDYHPPKGFLAYYPSLDKVYANCNVYEIPILVTYNFKSAGKHNWFVTTGLSSILMHTETYKYAYGSNSYGGGQLISNPYTIKNQNQHYFSTLTLSGGYEYKLSKTISLSASPYIKLPISGVGYGKVKLNSTGLLFTITANPFAKK